MTARSTSVPFLLYFKQSTMRYPLLALFSLPYFKMEAALLLYDWLWNNRALLRDQTSESHTHPAAEWRMPHAISPRIQGGTRGQERDVEFSDDKDRGGPLASGDVILVCISMATVCVCKQSAFCVEEGEASKEGRVKKDPPAELQQKNQDEPSYRISLSTLL